MNGVLAFLAVFNAGMCQTRSPRTRHAIDDQDKANWRGGRSHQTDKKSQALDLTDQYCSK